MLIERNEKTGKELALDAFARRLEACSENPDKSILGASLSDLQKGLRKARAYVQRTYCRLQFEIGLAMPFEPSDILKEFWPDDANIDYVYEWDTFWPDESEFDAELDKEFFPDA